MMSNGLKDYEFVLEPSRLTMQYQDCFLFTLRLWQKQMTGSDQQERAEKDNAGMDDWMLYRMLDGRVDRA